MFRLKAMTFVVSEEVLVGWLVGGQIESDPRGILEGSDPQIKSGEVLVGGGCVGE